MRAENLIVKGIYFGRTSEDELKTIRTLKDVIIMHFRNKGYTHVGPSDFFYNSLELNFQLHFPERKMPFLKRLFKTKRDLNRFSYDETLRNTRLGIPWQVRIHIYPGTHNESKGIILEVVSEPTIYYRIEQLNYSNSVGKEEYSRIIYENKEFVDGFSKSIGFITVKPAKPLSEYITTQVSDRLKEMNFVKISKLIEDGRTKMERGEDGLGNLIGVIENFLYELIERLKEKPYDLHQPEKNIKKLFTTGYLDQEMECSLKQALFDGIYLRLKDKDHKKEQIDLFDLRLYFDLTETVIDYLLNRVLIYKIRAIKSEADNKEHDRL